MAVATLTPEQRDIVANVQRIYDTESCPRCGGRLSQPVEGDHDRDVRWPCRNCKWWTPIELRRKDRPTWQPTVGLENF